MSQKYLKYYIMNKFFKLIKVILLVTDHLNFNTIFELRSIKV